MNGRSDALAIFDAAVAAAHPLEATAAHLPDLDPGIDRVFVVGAGKAAVAMAAAVERKYGARIAKGLVVTKYGHGGALTHIDCWEAAHPVPDAAGVRAAHAIGEICLGAGEKDLVICLISGGASALLPSPVSGLRLEQKQETTRLLLACGANIHELNCVRKHLSSVKGGQLAHLCSPARLHTYILSDVIGDPLDVIGSGPTVPDETSFADAWAVIYKYSLETKIPSAVRHHLEEGVNHRVPETPKPGDPIFDRVTNTLIGSNRISIDAAANQAKELGYTPFVLSTSLDGEAREVAKVFAAMAREVRESHRPAAPPLAILAGGETTVTLTQHHGLGGRNQEMALAAALGIQGLEGVTFLAAGTDGTDGPTNAAGALADGQTLTRAKALDLIAEEFLVRNDSHQFFEQLNDLIVTGPTGTNVMDVYLLLVE
ncbi:MAG: glycerate kinase [Sphingopyxis sp.]|nr:glycerate kinase [Sphingopyxis sp.]